MRHQMERRLCRTFVGQHIRAGAEQYALRGRIGSGAVGIVRKATRLRDNRIVAIKFFAPDPKYIDIAAFDDVAVRFRREGERGAGLEHERLVKIHAYEENENGSAFRGGVVRNPFLVMDHVRGSTLEDAIRRWSSRETPDVNVTSHSLSTALGVAQGLAYLHEHKIVHRDVKPANVFMSSGGIDHTPATVRLGDFGVTKWGDYRAAVASGTLTVSHEQGLGTLKYMSPEQAIKPKHVGVRSDVFSFGILCYELFTGRVLGSPHHVFAILSARKQKGSLTGKLYALGIRCGPFQESVFEIVLEMFHETPDARPSSSAVVGQLRYLLERLAETE